jgi:hypothetical protein
MDRLHLLAEAVALVVGSNKRKEATLYKHPLIPNALRAIFVLNRSYF